MQLSDPVSWLGLIFYRQAGYFISGFWDREETFLSLFLIFSGRIYSPWAFRWRVTLADKRTWPQLTCVASCGIMRYFPAAIDRPPGTHDQRGE